MRESLFHYALLIAFAVVTTAGCDSIKEIGSAPPPEPPPTPNAIAQAILANVQMTGPLPPEGTRLTNEETEAVLTVLRQAHMKHSENLDPKDPEVIQFNEEVLTIVDRAIEDRFEKARKAKLWKHALLYADAYAIFHPKSTRFSVSRELAVKELSKPEVSIRALFEDDDVRVAILDFHIPLTDETFKSLELEQGKSLHGMRFVEVIGLDRGIRMQNEETRAFVNVYFPHSL